ncbi:copper chaperone PCu(A)C [Cereibacter sphaeroides]|uniref:copper chaperone PCu(A)C n=1 Tax=Cereibacter sphaeroides TaxID=1063 RepID=UPI001F1CEC17|nr:copper chaperone PCu(A)C [Cereibacter sphaeroides]MCE6950101.1 copper chaperone PCu(A)C [Cereibacter sphaeroides]
MTLLKALMTAAAVAVAAPAFAESHLSVTDAYARVASPAAKSGGIFMVIENHGDSDDRLTGAASDAAELVELHTHVAGADGVMQMRKVEAGFPVPAHGSHALARGGDHVMLMGLTRPLADGDTVALKLSFESGKTIDLTVPVDLKRDAAAGQMMHGMTHGN